MLAKLLEYYGADLTYVSERGWRDIRCPFIDNHAHADRNKSARVNLELGGFKCFACGVKGDALKLIQEREGLGYLDALDFAKSVLGESVPELRRSALAERPRSQWRTTLFGDSFD